MPPKTATELKALVKKKEDDLLAEIRSKHTKTDIDLRAEIDKWVADVNASLDSKLSAAASAGRSFYIVDSPIFINPGQKADRSTDHNGKSLFFEAAFRAYLQSLRAPVFAVGSGVKVTEIVQIPPAGLAPTPALPQNVVMRYKFSW